MHLLVLETFRITLAKPQLLGLVFSKELYSERTSKDHKGSNPFLPLQWKYPQLMTLFLLQPTTNQRNPTVLFYKVS